MCDDIINVFQIKQLKVLFRKPATVLSGIKMSTAAAVVRDPTFFLGNGQTLDKTQFMDKITQECTKLTRY